MKCPICYNEETRVLDSRAAADDLAIRRRRECEKCNFRFSTYEEIEILDLVVIKNNGKREEYAREKLERGLRQALWKRELTHDNFKQLVNNIERDIQILVKNKKSGSEVTSTEIGGIVMGQLKKTDKVAYIRFASVYKSFAEPADFETALREVLTEK